MKSLADIRRRMQPGVSLEVVRQDKFPDQVGSVRTVAKAMTTQIKWASSAYSEWPKAKNLRILDADTYEYDVIEARTGTVYNTVGLRFLPGKVES